MRIPILNGLRVLLAIAPLLCSAAACADDSVSRADTTSDMTDADAPLNFSWSGAYMGVSIGSRWAEMGSALARLDNTPSERFDFVGRGVIGGTHVGYLEQFGHLVAGIELSISAGTVEESTLSAVVADRSRAMTLASMYQAVGRIGYAQDHWLVYAKGGFAIAAVSVSSGMASTGQLTTSSQGFAQGWTVGAGLEYALTDSIVLGTDYSYVSLEADDRRGVQRPGFANVRHTGIHADSHVVMTRLSYRFR